jgi:probable F420-dependent oxidoreductase
MTMKIDGSILVDDPTDAGAVARSLESIGYDGGFTFEGRHDPFLPLCVAAGQTERLELITAIAIAFARNPMTLANTAYDLQLQSKGRFILGLGSQIKPHIERRFSSVWSSPAARMREMVLAIRAIWASWQEGAKLDFRGEHFTHTLMTPVFNPGPNPFGLPRIFLAGFGPRMTAVVGEVADGFFLHPFHTDESVAKVTLPALEEGLSRGGRDRSDFEVSCQVIVAAGENDEQLEAAMNGARAQISFYASTPAYSGVLACHGMESLHEELNALSKRGEWLQMAARVPDELVERIAIVGPRAQVADRVRARYGRFADRVSLVSPFTPEPEAWADVVRALAEEA